MVSNIKPPFGQPWSQGISVLAGPSSDSILVMRYCPRLSGDPPVNTYLHSHSSMFPRGLNAFMQPLPPEMIELQPQRKRSQEAPVSKEAEAAVDQRCRPGILKNNGNSKKMWSEEEAQSPRGPRRETMRNLEV